MNRHANIVQALRAALADSGIKGELQIRFNGAVTVTWIGKPSADDQRVTVTIEPMTTGNHAQVIHRQEEA